MTEHDIDLTLCPSCGYAMNAATGITGGDPAGPKEGDVGVCLSCGVLLSYDAARVPSRPLTEEEIAQIPPDAKAMLDTAIDFVHKRGPLPPRGARA